MTDNQKLVKLVTLDYDLSILTLVALDHLKGEYETNRANCAQAEMGKETAYWDEKLGQIAATYASIFNGQVDLVDVEPGAVTQ